MTRITTTTISKFNGYDLAEDTRPDAKRFTLYDRADGPVISADTYGDLFHEAIDALDEYHDTNIRGAYTLGDYEAMEALIKWLARRERRAETHQVAA